MRILAVEPGPLFSVLDVHRGWTKALRRAGHDVIDAGHSERLAYFTRADELITDSATAPQDLARVAGEGLLAKAYLYAPDVLLVTSAFFVDPLMYRAFQDRGTTVVLLLTESPYEDANQYALASYANVAIINDPTNLDEFRRVQPNTFYLPHAYDPEVHHPRDPDPDKVCDLFWAGTAYPSRIDWWETVDLSGLDVKLAGNWQALDKGSRLHKYLVDDDPEWCMDNAEVAEWYSSARASVNTYRLEATSEAAAQGWAMGPREVELAATGCFYLTQSRPENRQVLPMVPVFSDPDDFSRKLRWWLDHDQARADVIGAAREAIADRTFDHSVTFLLNVLDNLSR